jgi:hypothetical protein
MGWVRTADDGYELAVEEGKLVCRNTAGKRLRSIPKQVKEDPAVLELRQLVEWLTRHAAECREQAERWLVRSLPVPATLITRIWPDEAWQTVLKDLVVVPVLDDGPDSGAGLGAWDTARAGFLRAADARGLGVVDLEGESVRLTAEQIAIPHPVLLTDLADLREFAVELNLRQSVDQLFRETWTRPASIEAQAVQFEEYARGRYPELRQLTQRAVAFGYQVRGGYAVCRVHEAGVGIEARVWVGADDPYSETETGALEFADGAGRRLRLLEVGPVAWSEGVRMAAALYAGRTVQESSTGTEAGQ